MTKNMIMKCIDADGIETLGIFVNGDNGVIGSDGQCYCREYFNTIEPVEVSEDIKKCFDELKKVHEAQTEETRRFIDLKREHERIEEKFGEERMLAAIRLERAVGIMNSDDFKVAFMESLPVDIRMKMAEANFFVRKPYGFMSSAWDDDMLCISRKVRIKPSDKQFDFIETDDDENPKLVEDADKYAQYLDIIKRNSVKLPLERFRLNEFLYLNDDGELFYSAYYEIKIMKERTKKYASELAAMATGKGE